MEALRDRIARGDDVDGRDGTGWTPLMWACAGGHHECARALIEAGAAVDTVNNNGYTALMLVCWNGRHECARALIDAGAAVDMVNNGGETALMKACKGGCHECTRALIDAHADLELMNRDGQNALMVACENPPSYFTQSRRQGRIECALVILAATAPFREPGFPDCATALKRASERLRQIETVLAMKHGIEDASPLARVRALMSDAQGIVVIFARDMLAMATLQSPVVGPAGSLPSAR